jgi:hypothetical protein
MPEGLPAPNWRRRYFIASAVALGGPPLAALLLIPPMHGPHFGAAVLASALGTVFAALCANLLVATALVLPRRPRRPRRGR